MSSFFSFFLRRKKNFDQLPARNTTLDLFNTIQFLCPIIHLVKSEAEAFEVEEPRLAAKTKASTRMEREISSPPSYYTTTWKYDVFLSFRGKDTRKNFTSHLYAALDQKGIFTFKDNHRLERGKIIWPEISKAIEESRFSVIVFSEHYASSKWCLDELAKILQCMKVMGQSVLPIFYNASPSEVRNQTGSFEKAFAEHEKNFSDDMERVRNWRVALTEIANLSGWHLQDREESEVIQDIANEISSKVSHTLLSASEKLVGMDYRLEQINLMLGTGLDEARILGICGMGGIGKTTLARFVFDNICYQFDGSTFLANVREVSQTRGLVALQEQLVSEILLDKNVKIWDVHKGCHMIRSKLRHKRVLLVIDDVDEFDQLQALAGQRDWFGLGSRIIITTRDRHLLVRCDVEDTYMVEKLNYNEALHLFSWKAFRKGHPTDGYFELSHGMVNYADGLPLALEILGSFLFGRSKAEWKDALDRLKYVPDQKIFEILKISYDGLQETEKKIFLDIACFFKGKDKDQVRELLDSCDFYPEIGISVLIDKCIITLSNNILCMHDLIQDMGREIVRQQSPGNPGQRSRLWLWMDISRVLTKNEGTEAVEGIICLQPSKGVKLNPKSFSRMKNLRLLKIRDVCLRHGIEYLPDELRLLKWHGYPLRSLPSNFQPERLFKLNICYSLVEQLWEGVQNMRHLKFIKLSHSVHLTKTPDFTGVPNLERLALDGCTNLSFVHPSIGLLKRLKVLNMKECIRIKSFPAEIEWASLEVLILSGCLKLSNVRQIVQNAKRLLQLHLDQTSIEEVPPSIKFLSRLTVLTLRDCKKLVSLPSSISDLRSLKVLNLNGCSKLEEVPENLGHVTSLENIDLGGTAIRRPPSTIVLLENLKELSFHGCKGQRKSWSSLIRLPFYPRANRDPLSFFIPSLSGLHCLSRLDLGDCNLQEGAIPNDLGSLSALTNLTLSRNNFFGLPASINQLSRLETLNIDYCNRLKALPELPASIDGLFAYNCTSLIKLCSPSNITRLTPRMFYLSNCFKLTGNMAIIFFKSLLQSLLKSQLRGLKSAVTSSEFDIVIPGSQVPEWFTYQSIEQSITIIPPTYCFNSFTGLAFCTAFSIHQHSSFLSHVSAPSNTLYLELVLEINGCHRHSVSISFDVNSLAQFNHLWLCYVSKSYFAAPEYPNPIKASFAARDHRYMKLKVKAFGLRFVFDQDVEEFIRSSSEFISEDLASDRLSVKPVIKRSSDYDLPYEQPHPKRVR